MDLLIIGAGAVGSAYGYFASQAGANVSYYIKSKYRDSLAAGLNLYHWKGRHAEPISFTNFQIFDSLEAVKAKKFDAILVTLPSDKLRGIESLLGATGDAKIWSLQTNSSDIEWIASKLGAGAYERLAWSRIPILSYLAPLPGENFEKTGYAFYLPPGAKALWAAKNPDLAKTGAELFSRGGLPSKVSAEDFRKTGFLEESVLRLIVAGLEKSEWSLDRLMNGENLYLVREGIRESTAILAKRYQTKDPGRSFLGKFASSLFGMKTIVRLATILIPFDFEAFMRVHFTKVEGQMHEGLDELIEAGKRNGISTTNLLLLRGRKKSLAAPREIHS